MRRNRRQVQMAQVNEFMFILEYELIGDVFRNVDSKMTIAKLMRRNYERFSIYNWIFVFLKYNLNN